MIPKRMDTYLRERLPVSSWQNRLERRGGQCFMEFQATDIDQLARLGIDSDVLGPQLMVCMWDESGPLEIGGYLVVDNLARGMTLKNAAVQMGAGSRELSPNRV